MKANKSVRSFNIDDSIYKNFNMTVTALGQGRNMSQLIEDMMYDFCIINKSKLIEKINEMKNDNSK